MPIRKLAWLFLFVPILVQAKVTEEQMQDVKVAIQKAGGQEFQKIIILPPEPNPNAYGGSGAIFVTANMLDYWDNVNQVAAVLAHEACHTFKGIGYEDMIDEVRAEICARPLMIKAGYDPIGGVQFYKKLIRDIGDSGPPSHPLSSDRVKFWATGNKEYLL